MTRNLFHKLITVFGKYIKFYDINGIVTREVLDTNANYISIKLGITKKNNCEEYSQDRTCECIPTYVPGVNDIAFNYTYEQIFNR